MARSYASRSPLEKIEELRRLRGRAARDESAAFIGEFFKRQVLKPHKQLGKLTDAWLALVPAEMVSRSAMVGFSRGVLTVAVPDSGTLYRLDTLLRQGLLGQLQAAAGTAGLRRVKLEVGLKEEEEAR